jgi:hypothetical protein
MDQQDRVLLHIHEKCIVLHTNFLPEAAAVSFELGAVTRASSQPVTPFSKEGAVLGTSSGAMRRQ